jgi:hypothetical protein
MSLSNDRATLRSGHVRIRGLEAEREKARERMRKKAEAREQPGEQPSRFRRAWRWMRATG